MNSGLKWISRLDSHHRLMIAFVVAGLAALLTSGMPAIPVRIAVVWVAYTFTVLVLMWITILLVHPRDLPKLSRIQDSSRLLILGFVVVAAIASLFAVVELIDSINDANRPQRIFLAILTVICSWSLVHTVFTLRYAHLYYGNDLTQTKRPGGLDFPHDPEPDYLDFAYFSFVIGMTSQVSDVSIGSKPMRRTALVHGLLSFLFNTIIIALTISGLSGAL